MTVVVGRDVQGRPAGMLVPGPGGWPEVAEVEPAYCPAGHRLGRGRVRVGWRPCPCAGTHFTPLGDTGGTGHGGHRTWMCRTCAAVILYPPHSPDPDPTERLYRP